MRTILSIYSDFARMLLGDRIYEDDTLAFGDICEALEVSPESLDEILCEELGVRGPEILQSFQKLLNLQAIKTHII